jgi:hypothetical protein
MLLLCVRACMLPRDGCCMLCSASGADDASPGGGL